jgi:hypothetical protein
MGDTISNRKTKIFKLIEGDETLKGISEGDILDTRPWLSFVDPKKLVTKVEGKRIETLTRARYSGKSMAHSTPRIIRTVYILDETGRVVEEEKIGDYMGGTPEYEQANRELRDVDLHPITKLYIVQY